MDSVFDHVYKERLFSVFKAAIAFFEENNLSWYACGGTVLGAVRHKGIIPWDDDVDILMPRDDYNRLLDLKEKIESTGFELLSLRDKGAYYTFAKFCDRSTTYWERRSIPVINGVWVDIFPLDFTELKLTDYISRYRYFSRIQRRYHLSVCDYSLEDLKNALHGKHIHLFIDIIRSLFLNKRLDSCYKTMCKISEMFAGEGEYAVSTCGVYGSREFFDRKWFESYEVVPFEDFHIRIPSGYHEYLKTMYGDYMQIPPINKRPHHSCYYVNLRERLTIDQIKVRLALGESCLY